MDIHMDAELGNSYHSPQQKARVINGGMGGRQYVLCDVWGAALERFEK
ncbi:hypothetical protein [Selenomonas ruminis]|nr:hypothetical protein [Selenomonas sp. mPRGC5]